MTQVVTIASPAHAIELRSERNLAAGLLFAAMVALLVPIVADFYHAFWAGGNDSQAPVILIAIGYGFWEKRELFDFVVTRGERVVGAALLLAGWALFGLGDWLAFYQLEGSALIPIALGLTLLTGGRKALSGLRFLIPILVFVIPFPGSLADDILVPLKLALSNMIVTLLALVGLPIAQNGTILSIGFHDMQIADACAGLRSLISLTAVGLLFVYFIGSSRRAVSVMMMLAIAPIAVLVNVLRITLVVLVTYFYGEGAGANFHALAPYLEVAGALGLMLLTHRLSERAVRFIQ